MIDLFPVVKLTLGILITFFVGYNIIKALSWSNLKIMGSLEIVFLSFPIGISVITLQMFILAIFGKGWSLFNMALPWVFLLLVNLAVFFMRKRRPAEPQAARSALDFVEKALICGIILQVIWVTLKAFALPIEAPDAIAIYALKAKAFYLKGGMDHDILKNVTFKDSHQDYPLLLPLAECWIYRALGNLNDFLAKALFPIFFLSATGIFYSMLKRFIKRRGSLLFTFMLASVPQFTVFGTNAYADLPLTCYYTASLLYLFLWMKEKETPYLLLSALMSFSAAWTKNEGSMLLVINILILAIFLARDKMRFVKKAISLSVYLAVVIVLLLPWISFKNSMALESDIVNKATITPSNVGANLGRVWPILYEYQKHLFGPKRWNIAWISVLVVFILKIRNVFRDEIGYIAFAAILCIAGYTFIYIVTPHDLGWHLSTSASRLMLHVLPVSMFWLALSTKKDLNLF
ncbi:MAG: glycosyltransferase family 39 protein [Candidatus Omnitrophota bacterium]